MPKRSLPSEKISSEIQRMAQEGIRDLSSIMIKNVQLFIQTTLEQEAEAYLGRKWAERETGETPVAYRNGYENYTVSTGEGEVTIKQPQFRNQTKSFDSKLLPAIKSHRTDSLELLAVQMWVGGLSQADIAEIFRHDLRIPNMSETVVQGLCQRLKATYEEFCKQDLSRNEIVYLFMDGIYLPLRKGTKMKEAVLAAIGITRTGQKVLLGFSVGPRESYESWKSFLRDMVERGLEMPILAIRDGNPGLIRALKEVFPFTAHQTCLAHKTLNLVEKMPKELLDEIRIKVHAALFESRDFETASKACKAIIVDYQGRAEAFVKCFEKDIDVMIGYLKFPQNHWKSMRTTNIIERRFGEVRRRTKVIPRFQTESSCLMLCHAVLIEYARKKPWRGVKMAEEDVSQLEAIKFSLQKEKKDLKKVA